MRFDDFEGDLGKLERRKKKKQIRIFPPKCFILFFVFFSNWTSVVGCWILFHEINPSSIINSFNLK